MTLDQLEDCISDLLQEALNAGLSVDEIASALEAQRMAFEETSAADHEDN